MQPWTVRTVRSQPRYSCLSFVRRLGRNRNKPSQSLASSLSLGIGGRECAGWDEMILKCQYAILDDALRYLTSAGQYCSHRPPSLRTPHP